MKATKKQLDALCRAIKEDVDECGFEKWLVQDAIRNKDHPLRLRILEFGHQYLIRRDDPFTHGTLEEIYCPRTSAQKTSEVLKSKRFKFIRGSLEELPEEQPYQSRGEFEFVELAMPSTSLEVLDKYFGGQCPSSERAKRCERHVTTIPAAIGFVHWQVRLPSPVSSRSPRGLFWILKRNGRMGMLGIKVQKTGEWHLVLDDWDGNHVWEAGMKFARYYPAS